LQLHGFLGLLVVMVGGAVVGVAEVES